MKLYYSIKEVSEMLNVNASHLRFLEVEFPTLKPRTDKRGVRHYTQFDINLLKQILHLTKDCGYTLEGARQQLLHNSKQKDPQGINKDSVINSLKEIRQQLIELKEQL